MATEHYGNASTGNESSWNVSMTTPNVEATISLTRDGMLAKLEISVLAIIFILAVLGNGTVLFALWMSSRKKKLSRMNLLIMHLSIADLFVAFFNVLPQLIWDITFLFKGGNLLCKSVTYLQVVAMYASSYVLISTALDRYIALCHPIASHTWSNKRTHIMVAIAWLVSFLLATPQLFIFGYRQFAPDMYNCWAVFDPEWTMLLYVTCFTIAIYIIPTIILILTYGRICYVVWQSSAIQQRSMRENKTWNKPRDVTNGHNNGKQTQQLMTSTTKCHPRVHTHTMSSSKVKTVKLTLTVIVCYFLCWSPFFICQMWAAWDINAPFQGGYSTFDLIFDDPTGSTHGGIFTPR